MSAKDIINRKLNNMKSQIKDLQTDLNKEPKIEKTTKNLVPPGVQEAESDTPDNDIDIPGVITGGPKMSKKWREV
jgi:hypothetical protein